jgi:hypothetical protein
MGGGIQNIPDWCRHLYRSCGSAKHQSQQAKLWISCSTAMFFGDCVKTCEDVDPNFGENRPGSFIMTTPRLTLPSSPSSFWRKTTWFSSPTHRASDLTPCDFFLFPKLKLKLKEADLIPLRRSKPNRRKCLTLWKKRTYRKRSKNGEDCRTGVYMLEGTTSRAMTADRPYGEFYYIYSVSPEYFEFPCYSRRQSWP